MSGHFVNKLLFLVSFIAIARVMWHFYPYRNVTVEDVSPAEDQAQPKEVQQQDSALAVSEQDEVTASPLVVRHLTDKATLLVRYRRMKQAFTAHLIVWSGAKRKGISDSYYDLGIIQGDELSEEGIEQLVAIARQQLDELAAKGKRKRRAAKAANPEEVAETVVTSAQVEAAPMVPEQSAVVPPAVVVEDTLPGEIKLRQFPSVYRGVIKEIGMMTQNKGAGDFETFGVRYETQEGIVDAVFGVNLREALRDAEAGVGDSVEILKIGRKTVEKGKAPMNLYKVAKLQPSA